MVPHSFIFMEEFYKVISKHIESLNEKFCIKQTLYDDIILVLRGSWGSPQLKLWTKIGDENVVYDTKLNPPIVTYENL